MIPLNLASRLVHAVIGLLIALCAGLEFFPFSPLGLEHLSASWGRELSSVYSPLLMALALMLIYLSNARVTIQNLRSKAKFLWISALFAVCVMVSALANQVPDARVPVAACNFLLGSIFLISLARANLFLATDFRPALFALTVWIVIPLIAVAVGVQAQFFLNCNPLNFHGFTNGRLLFGFWSGCLVVMLAAYCDDNNKPLVIRAAFLVSYCALVATQTRTAIGLATLTVFWLQWETLKNVLHKTLVFLLSLTVGLAMTMHFNSICNAGVTEYSSRFLEFKDPNRLNIYLGFIPSNSHQWLWGEGKVKLVSIASIGDGIQAHNLFLQTLANYGAFSLSFFVIWCWQLQYLFKTMAARLLCAYFLGFSFMQPLFGSGLNYFTPRNLLVLMLAVYFDHALFNRSRRNL